MTAGFQITRLTKTNGPLTKRISLMPDGAVKSDGSACTMAQGSAERLSVNGAAQLADIIGGLTSNQAIALGALQKHLPTHVNVVTKRRLVELNGSAAPDTIVRTGDYIGYQPESQAFVLLDFDTKGMPATVADRLREMGGFWDALVQVLPELAGVARVSRRSTSAGLYRTDTGERLQGSGGWHVFVAIQDGSDAERFLKTLHERCMLHGLGWEMVGAGGQLLERSIVDRMVGAPERLVFEGDPILDPPIAQNHEVRRPISEDGMLLDTVSACPPLTILEQTKLRGIRATEAQRLRPESQRARQSFIDQQSERLAAAGMMTPEQAQRAVARQCEGILLPNIVLPFDNPDLATCTVADVLADPSRFVGETLADPLEGPDYGSCKAKVMLKADGTPWIHSFAHGRTVYELRHDAAAIAKALDGAKPDQATEIFVQMALSGDLSEEELEALAASASRRSGSGIRAINRQLKQAKANHAARNAEERRASRMAERRDPRPQIVAPLPDAPWLPQMRLLNDVLGSSRESEPPMRDADGYITAVRVRPASSMHALTAAATNEGQPVADHSPAPEQPLLTRSDGAQLAEMIERYIEFTDAEGRAVHLGHGFVQHFLKRSDGLLPVVSAVATLPMVLANGEILSGRGLAKDRGVVFRIPPGLQDAVPRTEECSLTAVARALQFLCTEWLCDVATDFAGKCVIVAAALTIMERLLFPERPAFFITAGQRGGGKTTTANLIMVAATGRKASAAAWSPQDEERRKALLAYLGEGAPSIVWDNIPRGSAISCPSIEKALTAETYTDRVLGVSDTRTVPATAVQLFTGNNITARGDMASRSLVIRLNVDRPDPENRKFRHADAVGWTEVNRPAILRALYTILLGNPRLRAVVPGAAETRFKAWWHLVGSAVENAAKEYAEHAASLTLGVPNNCKPAKISFRELFLAGEADEEQSSSLAMVLDTFRTKWPAGAKANDVTRYMDGSSEDGLAFRGALEQARGKALRILTPTAVSWHLKALGDAPVQVSGKILTLKYTSDHEGGSFRVEVKNS